MSSGESWFVAWQGKVQGPLPWEKVQELARAGRLKREMQLSQDKTSWTPASSMPGLFEPAGSDDFLTPGESPASSPASRRAAAVSEQAKKRAREASAAARQFADEAKVALSKVPKRFLAVPLVAGLLIGIIGGQMFLPLWLTSSTRLLEALMNRATSATEAEIDAWQDALRAAERSKEREEDEGAKDREAERIRKMIHGK